MIENSSGVIFTPNVLSETSNLLRQIDDPIRTEISKAFKNIIHRATEEIVESRIAVARSEFVRLGLTDSVLLEAASKGLTILTADLDLYLAALSSNLSAINYTHIQEERSDFQ
ncbi:hypothetical protein [Labrys wisconsinensis]|uniref:PIN domain-containing protein n=1 Tax=Labrys wisconsinensis TaxID=425677 RepID=A0ABU0J3V2_9HYPH|nr:hypothetical protein [Labrys wisconsinensis]MDQ0467984.1 hypothetical protein [Labrys wisconsinensis]